jgi:magnesium-transporting ATPase (P-type)
MDYHFLSFNATYLYQYTFILLYNLAFTSLPVIILGGRFLSPHPLSQ